MSPFQLLGLTSEASLGDVQRAWRRAAMKHHPDRGGDPEKFQEVSVAYQACLQAVATRVCGSCHGSGKKTIQQGFYSHKTRCQSCKGTGKPL